jgi:cell shape-determining protein MreC
LFFAVSRAGFGQEEATNQVAELQRQLADRNATIRRLTNELAGARTESDSYQRLWKEAQLRAAGGASASATLDAARVVAVNWNLRLVVLNVGQARGTRVGMPVVVLHGDRVIAELRVVEVRKKICGAVIEKLENHVTLNAGDSARVTKS